MKSAVLFVLALVLGIAILIGGSDVCSELEELRVTTKPIAEVEARVREARINIDGFSWSPDGRFFSYKTWWENDSGWTGRLTLVDLTQPSDRFENIRPLYVEGPPRFGANITWAHDSKRVILNNDWGTLSKSYLIDIESGKKSEISVPENWVIFDESFAPNDSLIVCGAVHFDTSQRQKSGLSWGAEHLVHVGPWRIAVIDLDKGNFHLIPEDTAAGEQFSPSWSADGKSITYCAAKGGLLSLACSHYSLDLITGVKRKMFDEEVDSLPGERRPFMYREVFSPGSRFVADLYIREDKTFLRIREPHTGKQKLLKAYKQPIRFPVAWSPDGRSVCYVREDPFYVDKEPRFAFAPRQIVMATIEE
jgi:hypothetical protein